MEESMLTEFSIKFYTRLAIGCAAGSAIIIWDLISSLVEWGYL